ncbi:unnamed protein product [Ectocarpus sp. CCAP 1310/34]|nr:unnamed protein product [Ectocarpus sp. CCAP 1310/34]
MTLYGRATRFIAIKTLLVGRCFVRGYAYVAPSCMLSRFSQQRHRQLQSAGLSILPLNRCSSGSKRGGTSLTGVRKPRAPMIGPELPPAPPPPTLYDADGNELSKPTKRKVAIVVGYVGTAFHGWQQSTDAQNVRTVEGELETALWKAGAIADSNYGDLNKIGWGRTSRTDKGVHASKTVAAAKLLLPQETFTAAGMSQYGKDKLNENLPDDIRCFSVSKVPKSFRGREECTLREYTYYLPRELLPDDGSLGKFRELLKLFVGTHSFHNYASTKGRQLKEVRKRVKASIDLKKSGGKPAQEAGGTASTSAPGSEEEAATAGGGDAGESGSKKRRWVSKDEWRTYRYKKKSTADQKADDAWFGKQSAAGAAPEESVGAAAAAEPPVVAVAGAEQQAGGDEGPESASPRSVEGGTSGDAVGTADAGSVAAVAAVVTPKDVASAGRAAGAEGVVVKSDVGETEAGGDAASVVSAPGAQEAEGVGGEDEGPEKQILLRELRTSIGGTLAVWGDSKEGNAMKTTGRLQTLLTREQLREAERWSYEHILPAVADAWETRGTAKLFLEAVEKFFVGQQQEEPLLKAIAENLSEISESERRAEEKYNKFRVLAKERGSTKYKDLLPKSIATGIICKFRLLPGNKVSAIQRGVVERMNKGELPPLAEVEEILAFIEKIGVDQVALDGGFVAPDVKGGGGGGGAAAKSAATPAAAEVATTT